MLTVLLYDLSVHYNRREIACEGMCKVVVDGNSRFVDSLYLESNQDFLYIPDGE